MKELHNHIFSNTTCISKETMLRYINKQLSKQELHDVEKHMLDCELCSEAYEGLKYAHNSSMLFAIDNQIDQMVRKGESRVPVMRTLMVAASILLITSGAFFTINYFNKTVDSEKELAVNEYASPLQKVLEEKNSGQIATGESIDPDTPGEELKTQEQSEMVYGYSAEGANKDRIGLKQDESYRTSSNEPSTATIDENRMNEMNDVPSADLVDNVSLIEMEDKEESLVFSSVGDSDKKEVKKEKEKLPEGSGLATTVNTENSLDDNFNAAANERNSESASFGNNNYFKSAQDNSVEKSKKGKTTTKDRRAKVSNNSKVESSTPSPAYNVAGKLEEVAEEKLVDNKRQTITINSYKVVDYTEEYQKQYDLSKNIETKSVSADFETKQDKDVAEKEREEVTVEITYKETLEKAITLYKNKKYAQAIEQFDLILTTHPDEVNGLFYGGLSNYHLQRYDEANGKLNQVLKNKNTEFNEEATWYKALSLIELKETDKAKKLLKEIVSGNGFYKSKAEEKLKGL